MSVHVIMFRGGDATAVNALQAAMHRKLPLANGVKFADSAREDGPARISAITMVDASAFSGGGHSLAMLPAPAQVFAGKGPEARRRYGSFVAALPANSLSIVAHRNEGETQSFEVYTDIPKSFTEKKWADGYDRLPDDVNEAISRMSELYHNFGGYTAEQNRQLSRKLTTHVNALLAMDAEALAAWHAGNLGLIKAVEANLQLYRLM